MAACLIVAAVPACKNPRVEGVAQCQETGLCPDVDKPYLYLDQCPEECGALIPAPTLVDTHISPFGGKVPLDIDFRADVEFPFPEMASGATLAWDVDGVEGVDATVPFDESVAFAYQDCTDVTVRVTPFDGLGRPGNTVERVLKLSCNLPPIIDLFVAFLDGNPNAPPAGVPGTTIRFVFAAHDPDNQDPDLDSKNGVARYDFDWEGDGVYDDAVDGGLADLGNVFTYGHAGVFRPTLRAIDGEGDAGVSEPLRVSMFAEVVQRGAERLVAAATAIAAPGFASAQLPATGVTLGLGAAGYGFAERADETEPLRLTAAAHAGTLVDYIHELVPVSDVVIAASDEAGLVLWRQRQASGAVAPAAAVRFDCSANVGVANRLAVAHVDDAGPALRVVVGAADSAQVRVYDATPLLGTFVPAQGCDGHLTVFGTGLLNRNATPFGANYAVVALAPLRDTLFAAVAATNGVDYGVAAYSLIDAALAPACATTDAGCLPTPAAVAALAAAPGTVAASGLSLLPDPVTAGVTGYALERFFRDTTAPAAATLWVNGVPYAAGAATWWFAGPATLAVPAAFDLTVAAAADVTLQAAAEDLLAIADAAGAISLYAVTVTGAAPTFALRATATAPGVVSELMLHDGWLLWADRGSPFAAGGADFLARQQRGLYGAATVAPADWLRLLPRNTAAQDEASYTGPFAAAADGASGLWVADGSAGVYRVDLAAAAALLPGAPAATSDATLTDALTLGGRILDVRVDAGTGTAMAALGRAGVVSFDAGSATRPLFRWHRPTAEDASHVEMLPPKGANPLLGMWAGSRRVETFRDDDPIGLVDRYTPALNRTIVHLRAAEDQSGDARAIAQVSERTTSNTPTYLLLGVANNGRWQDGGGDGTRMYRVPEDFAADGAGVNMTDVPPVFGNLTPGGVDRVMFFYGGHNDRFCIEPLWGGSCAHDLFEGETPGLPYGATIGGDRYALFFNAASAGFTVIGPEGNRLFENYSPCGDLPESEQLFCLQKDTILATAAADPFWLLVTRAGLSVVDLRDPQRPQLVARLIGDLGPTTGWYDGTRLRVITSNGSQTQVRLYDVDDLAAPP